MEQLETRNNTPTGIVLATQILSGSVSIAKQELSLRVEDTLSKPILRSVFKNDGDAGFVFVTALVKRFVDGFGFSTKLSEVQVETITVDALEHFSYETIEDLILFFKMARTGKLGVTNRGVDSNLIFGEWLPKYLEIKSIAREKINRESREEMPRSLATIEDVAHTYKEKAAHRDRQKVIEYIDRITKDYDKQMLEDLIIDWQKDDKKKYFVHLLKRKRKQIK